MCCGKIICTARKRSLGQGNIFTSVCQEFCPQGGRGVCLWSRGYPTRMHSCCMDLKNQHWYVPQRNLLIWGTEISWSSCFQSRKRDSSHVHNKWIYFELTNRELPRIPQGLKTVVHSSSWILFGNNEQQVDINGRNKSRPISSLAHCFLG